MRSSVSARASTPSRDRTRGSAARRGSNCPWPTSTATTRLAPRASSTSVKPPVEAPRSRQAKPRGVEPERVERRGGAQHLAARDIGVGRRGLDRCTLSPISSDGFFSATPPTRTSPAAIAACARARLEKKPRSTRTISARLRIGPCGWRDGGVLSTCAAGSPSTAAHRRMTSKGRARIDGGKGALNPLTECIRSLTWMCGRGLSRCPRWP